MHRVKTHTCCRLSSLPGRTFISRSYSIISLYKSRTSIRAGQSRALQSKVNDSWKEERREYNNWRRIDKWQRGHFRFQRSFVAEMNGTFSHCLCVSFHLQRMTNPHLDLHTFDNDKNKVSQSLSIYLSIYLSVCLSKIESRTWRLTWSGKPSNRRRHPQACMKQDYI